MSSIYCNTAKHLHYNDQEEGLNTRREFAHDITCSKIYACYEVKLRF
jgi:hypothetical protein